MSRFRKRLGNGVRKYEENYYIRPMIGLRCLIRASNDLVVATPLIQYVCFSSRVDERLFNRMRPQELYHNVKTILQLTLKVNLILSNL